MNRNTRCQLVTLRWAILTLGIGRDIQAEEPLDLAKTAAEQAVQVLKDPALKGPAKKKERIERLKEIINPIFDYEEMARRTVGQHWRRRTRSEREEFVRLFRAFLEKVYPDKVDFYDAEKVNFGHGTIDEDYAQSNRL